MPKTLGIWEWGCPKRRDAQNAVTAQTKMQEPISQPSESKLLKTGWIEILLRLSSNYHQVPTRRRRTDSLHSRRILGDKRAVSRRARRKKRDKSFQSFQAWAEGVFRSCLKTLVAPFLPARLTAAGSPRMDSTRLKERLRGTLRLTDTQRDLKVELTLLTSVPGSPFMFHIAGEGVLPIMACTGRLHPKRVRFSA